MLKETHQRYLELKSSQFWIKSDINISEDEIACILASKNAESHKRLPEIRKILNTEVSSPLHLNSILDGGTFCLLFEASTSENEQVVVKSSLLPSPYISFDFYAEKHIITLLNNMHIPSVPILDIDCSRSKYAFDYMIMEKVNGSSLSCFINDAQKAPKYLHQLGKTLAQVHHIKVNGYGPLVSDLSLEPNSYIGLRKSWKEYLYTQLDVHIKYCYDKKIIDLNQSDMIGEIFLTHEKVFDIAQPCLLHGDLGNQNIFIQQDTDAVVLIDWGDALSGDPVFDIAMWGSFIGNHEKLNFLLEGYQSLSNLHIDFKLRYWLYYLRIMLAKTVHRHRFNYSKSDKIPALSRILLPMKELSTLT